MPCPLRQASYPRQSPACFTHPAGWPLSSFFRTGPVVCDVWWLGTAQRLVLELWAWRAAAVTQRTGCCSSVRRWGRKLLSVCLSAKGTQKWSWSLTRVPCPGSELGLLQAVIQVRCKPPLAALTFPEAEQNQWPLGFLVLTFSVLGSPSVNWEETVRILQTGRAGMREHTFVAGHELALVLRGGEERLCTLPLCFLSSIRLPLWPQPKPAVMCACSLHLTMVYTCPVY